MSVEFDQHRDVNLTNVAETIWHFKLTPLEIAVRLKQYTQVDEDSDSEVARELRSIGWLRSKKD